MKVIIEYSAPDDDPVEQATDALNVYRYKAALENIRNELRKHWKWGEFTHEETHALVDELYKFVSESMAEAGMEL